MKELIVTALFIVVVVGLLATSVTGDKDSMKSNMTGLMQKSTSQISDVID